MSVRTRSRKAKDSPADFLRAQAVEFYDFALTLRKHRAALLDDPRLVAVGDMLRNAGELLYDVTVDIQLGRLRPAAQADAAPLPLFDGGPTDGRVDHPALPELPIPIRHGEMDTDRQQPPRNTVFADVEQRHAAGGDAAGPELVDSGAASDPAQPDPAPIKVNPGSVVDRAEPAADGPINSDPTLECFDILNNGKPFDTVRAASEESALKAARLKYPTKRKLSVRSRHPDPIEGGKPDGRVDDPRTPVALPSIQGDTLEAGQPAERADAPIVVSGSPDVGGGDSPDPGVDGEGTAERVAGQQPAHAMDGADPDDGDTVEEEEEDEPPRPPSWRVNVPGLAEPLRFRAHDADIVRSFLAASLPPEAAAGAAIEPADGDEAQAWNYHRLYTDAHDHTADKERLYLPREHAKDIPASPHDREAIKALRDYRARREEGEPHDTPQWGRWSEFSVLLPDGTVVRVLHDFVSSYGPTHLEFYGPVSTTGYRSHFLTPAQLVVGEAEGIVAFARNFAAGLNAELQKEYAKKIKKPKAPKKAKPEAATPPAALPAGFHVFEVIHQGKAIDTVEARIAEAPRGVATARHYGKDIAMRLQGDDQVEAGPFDVMELNPPGYPKTDDAHPAPEPTAAPTPAVKVNTTWTGAEQRFFVQVQYGPRKFADFEFEYKGTLQGKAGYLVHLPSGLGFHPDEVFVEEEIQIHVPTNVWAERVAVGLMTAHLVKLAAQVAEEDAKASEEAEPEPIAEAPFDPYQGHDFRPSKLMEAEERLAAEKKPAGDKPQPMAPAGYYWQINAPDMAPMILKASTVEQADAFAASLIEGWDREDQACYIQPIPRREMDGRSFVEIKPPDTNLTADEWLHYQAGRSPGALLMKEAIEKWLESDQKHPRWGEWFEHRVTLDPGAIVAFVHKPDPGANSDTYQLTARGPVSTTGSTSLRMSPSESERARADGVGPTLQKLAEKLNAKARAEVAASRKKTAQAKAGRRKQGATA